MTEKAPVEKKAKFTSPAPRPFLNVNTITASTSPIRNFQSDYTLPSPMLSTPSPLALSKVAFVSLFESLYEKIEEVNKLHAILKDHSRKSSLLLQTLHGSGQMIEGLVKAQVKEANTLFTEGTLKGLTDRISAIEGKIGAKKTSGTTLGEKSS